MGRLNFLRLAAALLLSAASFVSQAACDPDGVQASGSKYRICMPPAGQYNGILVVWAHGFQDAGTPVQIPEDQLCIGSFCIPDIVNSLGYGFATNSYSKTGLAIVQGKNDLLDLVNIYAAQKGAPSKVFLVGASEGGIITTLSLEQRPDVYSAGLAICGPIGDFPLQIKYFGDARVTFDHFFPGVIPGPAFDPHPMLVANWALYYDTIVKPIALHPSLRQNLDEWVAAASLPYDGTRYLETVEQSMRDVLRYSIVNLKDAATTLGGFPFDNLTQWYRGSSNDLWMNINVERVAADPAALAEMEANYKTVGILQRPLITMHTLLDQQVPFVHEQYYVLKTAASGAWFNRHLLLTADRYGHCNFTPDEVLFGFVVMLFYDGLVQSVSGLDAVLTPDQAAAFEARARAYGIPVTRGGSTFSIGPGKNRSGR